MKKLLAITLCFLASYSSYSQQSDATLEETIEWITEYGLGKGYLNKYEESDGFKFRSEISFYLKNGETYVKNYFRFFNNGVWDYVDSKEDELPRSLKSLLEDNGSNFSVLRQSTSVKNAKTIFLWRRIYFSDETLARRFLKALNHICYLEKINYEFLTEEENKLRLKKLENKF